MVDQQTFPTMTPEQAMNIDAEYFYGGDDLGATWGPESSSFVLWAPTASAVELVTFADDAPDAPESRALPMVPSSKGTWRAQLDGDAAGISYIYRVHFADGTVNDAPDPYATAAVANGRRSVLLSPSQRSIGAFERMAPFSAPTDAVIAETHVRDLTKDASSGADGDMRGRFLGVIQPGTANAAGSPTGLDYIRRLGITHLQIQPMFDFESVDETAPLDDANYNWGYDPLNYNVPEGSYATDAADPAVRVREAKMMVKGLHDAGLRVVMDVVYNHVNDAATHPFSLAVPGYYFRADADGNPTNDSECGNDTASERRMMRKYIVDSVRFWANEYKVDGFRFDLMGLHDIDTMQAVREALDDIDPSIVIVGEGWDMATTLPNTETAIQRNAEELTGRQCDVAFFNDSIRDGLKGHVFEAQETGYVSGKEGLEPLILHNMLGFGPGDDAGLGSAGDSEAAYAHPGQVVQYAEIHDNFTLWDKLAASRPDDADDVRLRRALLADAAVFLSQGVAEMQLGQEFLRTKGGDENSYRSGDSVNALDWNRQDEPAFAASVAFVRGLIALRRAIPALRYGTYEEIAANATPLVAADGVVAYAVRDAAGTYVVALNASEDAAAAVDLSKIGGAAAAGTAAAGTAGSGVVEGAGESPAADGAHDDSSKSAGEWKALVSDGVVHVASLAPAALEAAPAADVADGALRVAPLSATLAFMAA